MLKKYTLLWPSFLCFWIFSNFQSIAQFLPRSAEKGLPVSVQYSAEFDSILHKIHSSLKNKKKKVSFTTPEKYLKYEIASSEIILKASSRAIYTKNPIPYFVVRGTDSTLITPIYPKHSLRNQYSNFWRKAARGELLIGGIELLGMGGLILMPREVTHWDPDWMQSAKRNIGRAFTLPPVWDKDDWVFNYIGHPVAGAYYYNAVRSQDAKWWESFLFSTFQSFFWEYVIEGMAERPSIQDLIITPIGGLILGESTHMITMDMRKNGFRFFEKVFVLVFNPMFVVNNGFGPKHNPPRTKSKMLFAYR